MVTAQFLYPLISGLYMGAGKSKPKEHGQRSMSLDGTIGTGSDSGRFHHLGPAQQTQTPNRSPAVGTGRRGHQGQHQHVPTNTPESALFGGVHTGTITSPQRGPLAGKEAVRKRLYGFVFFFVLYCFLQPLWWDKLTVSSFTFHVLDRDVDRWSHIMKYQFPFPH